MQYYTISKLATILGVPETTLRNWRDRFPEFISSIGSGRSRKYQEDVVAVFEAIRRLSKDGAATDSIRMHLQNEFTIHPDPISYSAASQIMSLAASFDFNQAPDMQHPHQIQTLQQEVWRNLFRQTLSEAFFKYDQQQTARLESLEDKIQELQAQAVSHEQHIHRLQDSMDQVTILKSRKETHGKKDSLRGLFRRIDQFLIKNKIDKQPEEQFH